MYYALVMKLFARICEVGITLPSKKFSPINKAGLTTSKSTCSARSASETAFQPAGNAVLFV